MYRKSGSWKRLSWCSLTSLPGFLFSNTVVEIGDRLGQNGSPHCCVQVSDVSLSHLVHHCCVQVSCFITSGPSLLCSGFSYFITYSPSLLCSGGSFFHLCNINTFHFHLPQWGRWTPKSKPGICVRECSLFTWGGAGKLELGHLFCLKRLHTPPSEQHKSY